MRLTVLVNNGIVVVVLDDNILDWLLNPLEDIGEADLDWFRFLSDFDESTGGD